MILRELIDLINSGEAVGIVGSGVSVEAGVPSWQQLFTKMAEKIDSAGLGADIESARRLFPSNLPAAFEALQPTMTTKDIHAAVAGMVGIAQTPGKHHKRIANWPFKFIITTNYDRLIEKAGNLITVGNRQNELFKMASGVADVVWHIHGAIETPENESMLVVTQSDYTELYPNSNCRETLKSIASTHRCIYFGFGFQDQDFLHVLEAVGRLGNKGRPSYAFVGYEGDRKSAEKKVQELLEKYNVQIIPYKIFSADHERLHQLLTGYDPFIVRKDLFQGRRSNHTPAYDPVAASLRVQASIDLREMSSKSPSIHQSLIGARLLSLIRERVRVPFSEIIRDCTAAGITTSDVEGALSQLEENGTIARTAEQFSLTQKYTTESQAAQAKADLARARFLAAIAKRVEDRNPELSSVAKKTVADTIALFMAELCQKRGLGVAQNLVTSDNVQAARRTVALVQGLPAYVQMCSREEALAIVGSVADLLTSPKPEESQFLGLLSQVYFGEHLVRASDNLAKADLDIISRNCYILDASVLICLLADGGEANEFTRQLLTDLGKCGATLVTTDLFASELLEHLNWAVKLVQKDGELSAAVLDALRGVKNYRSNQFLQGYFSAKHVDASFRAYICRVLGVRSLNDISDQTIRESLERNGIDVLSYAQWRGFGNEHITQRDATQREIDVRRTANGTFKHHRQTQAEAEVAVLVDQIRKGSLAPPTEEVEDAYFISSTRVVDDLPGMERRISLLPEGLAQWLLTCEEMSPERAALIFDQLLWDLAQNGIQFVNKLTLLSRFSGVIEASRAELDSSISDRKELLLEKYGPDPASAFAEADPLDFPRFASEASREMVARLEREVAKANLVASSAKDQARRSEKDRAEFGQLKAEAAERKRKAGQKKRGAASKKGSKKRR